MTAPTATLSITDRYKLKELKLEQSATVTPGRVMICQGRKIIGFTDVEALPRFAVLIPKDATGLCLSPDDYDDVKGWLG